MSFKKIAELADKFEMKLVLGQAQVSQAGTTELFFDSESNQMKFSTAAKDQSGPVAKILLDYFSKSEKPCGFSLKAVAESGTGASWDLTVTPTSLMPKISSALDSVFKSVMGESMALRLAKAKAGAKTGGGSGSLQITGLDLD